MTSPLKILYVYIYCNQGGVTSVLKQRALNLPDYHLDGLFQIEYGGREELLKFGFKNVLITQDIARSLETELAENDYDVVTIIDMPEIAQKVLDMDFSGKVIYEIHTPMLDVLLKNDPATLSAVDQIVVPSNWSKNWILRHFPVLDANKVSACGNIVDPKLFKAQSHAGLTDNRSLVWVGKFGDYKNWHQAIDIADRYLKDQPEARAFLVTGGRLTDAVMNEALEKINETKNSRRILWLHNLSYEGMADLYQRVASTDGVFLSCSNAESFCMVIHEASRCGLPVVTTAAGAVTEFIEHEITGLLFDPSETSNATDALARVVSDSKLRSKILDGAETKLQTYSPENLIESYVASIS